MATLEVRGRNFISVHVRDNFSMWFSYKVCIAFVWEDRLYITDSRNQPGACWTTTTAKHINQLPTDLIKTVLPADEFDAILETAKVNTP